MSAACGPPDRDAGTDATEDLPFFETDMRDVGFFDAQRQDVGEPPIDASDAVVPDAGPVPAEVALGGQFSCARVTDGTVRCWGVNTFGQIGDGSLVRRVVPTEVSGITSATQIGVGGAHACALMADRTVRCWGANNFGQLGDGSMINRLTSSQVLGLSNVAEIALGAAHTCARLMNGTVQCWGAGSLGQLGIGTNPMAVLRATIVMGLNLVASISAGALHTCAVLTNGGMRCWGSNAHGELGDGSTTMSLVPVIVSMLTNGAQIAVGPTHTCVRQVTRAVRCWGRNTDGEIGDGATTDRLVPTAVPGLLALDISLGGGVPMMSGFTCAIGMDATPRCWGANDSGQLGVGSTGAPHVNPTIVAALTNQLQIATGGGHTCAIAMDAAHTLHCWGLNDEGQLGIGIFGVNRAMPAVVSW